MSTDEHAVVALSRVPTIGAKLYRALIRYFGNPRDALNASCRELLRVPGIGRETARQFRQTDHWREADRIVAFAQRNHVRILAYGSADYPASLSGCENAPPVMYLRGEVSLEHPRRIAVVGTRRMSALGARQVETILDQLVEYEPLIVSGLAYGVDIAAHRRAMSVGLPTVAVLGSGLGRIYPAAHRDDAHRMCESGGGLLTEYPHWVGPEREHFPARNRIVALLSEFTLVVESDVRGGSIITATMAGDYGRKVGACPGRGGDAGTAGCNHLIKAGRAHLIETGEDIARLLNWQTTGGAQSQLGLFDDLEPRERRLVERLREVPALAADELHRSVQMPVAELSSVLLGLEIKGVVASLPGQRYRLIGS